MGRDKALLELDEPGITLLEKTASLVKLVAGSVTVVGGEERYGNLGLPVMADLIPEIGPHKIGPMGGLITILKRTQAEWNLLVACDMPHLNVELLRNLLLAAVESNADCVLAEGPDGRLHPLCAVYHRRCLPEVGRLISNKCFTMHRLIEILDAKHWFVADNRLLGNVNTPADLALETGANAP